MEINRFASRETQIKTNNPANLERLSFQSLLRLLIRGITLVLIADFLMATLSTTYFRAMMGIIPTNYGWDVLFRMASTIVLPLILTVESLRKGVPSGKQSILILDFVLTAIWFCFFWGSVLYAFVNSSII